MMKLIDYNQKHVEIIDSRDYKYNGYARFEDADTLEADEDSLIIRNIEDNQIYDIPESSIKSIKIIND